MITGAKGLYGYADGFGCSTIEVGLVDRIAVDDPTSNCLLSPPYEYSSQLLSPMGVVRIMARVVMMVVVTIITTKVVWIGIVIEVRVWVIIWFRIELPL